MERTRWIDREEREKVVNRQGEKQIVALLPNVISMQMTDKKLKRRRMETVTTAADVAVATENSKQQA